MKKTYLLQRAKFEDDSSRKGIDSVLSFDYMGSHEFECGALPQSLKSIREDISKYIHFQYYFKDYPSKCASVFCKKEAKDSVIDTIEQLSKKELRLKEYCDLDKYISDDNKFRHSDFWWDIENNFMFWKFNPDFGSKFLELIKNK
jgi:hypothetical protein